MLVVTRISGPNGPAEAGHYKQLPLGKRELRDASCYSAISTTGRPM